MKKSFVTIGVALCATFAVHACSSAPQSPTSPSAAIGGTTNAAADGSTLKASAPSAVSPGGGERVNSRRPTLSWTESTGRFESLGGLSYDVEVRAGGSVVYAATAAGTSHEVQNEGEFDTEYTWRVRARLDTAVGPWSAPATFISPAPGAVSFGSTGGPVGPPRDIGVNEALNIIMAIYNAGGYRIDGGSRAQRNAYLEIAVAALHYGHGRWNPQGPDPNWCIKNGGDGRPQSDDVIVRCNSRDAWDLVGGLGAPGARWHADYIGRLPGNQAVYPPSPDALNRLP
jgi:hypothetical protein